MTPVVEMGVTRTRIHGCMQATARAASELPTQRSSAFPELGKQHASALPAPPGHLCAGSRQLGRALRLWHCQQQEPGWHMRLGELWAKAALLGHLGRY